MKVQEKKCLMQLKKLVDSSLLLCLNTIPNSSDTIAKNVQYHLTCWVSVKRKAQPDSINIQEIIDIERVFADIEMLTQCKQHLYIQQTILECVKQLL